MKKLNLFCGIFFLLLTSCKPGTGQNAANDPAAFNGPGTPPINGPITDLKLSCEEAKFVYFLNIYRRSNGLNSLSVSRSAVLSSRWHAQDMSSKNYFAHTEPNGRTFDQRASSFGYYAWAENIAGGFWEASRTFCQSKGSPGHNQNMLASQHASVGIGVASGGMYDVNWSNNYGPGSSDSLQLPLTLDPNCSMPSALPGC